MSAIKRNVASAIKKERKGVRNVLKKTDFQIWILDFTIIKEPAHQGGKLNMALSAITQKREIYKAS